MEWSWIPAKRAALRQVRDDNDSRCDCFFSGKPDGSNRTRRAVTVEALLFEFRREFPRPAASFGHAACPSLTADLADFAGGKFEVSVLP